MNSPSFNLHRDSSNSLTLSNVGELSWSCIPEKLNPSSERERKFHSSLFTSSIKREIRHFLVVVVQWWQRNVQKSVITCKVVVLLIKPIVFLTFSLPSALLHLKRDLKIRRRRRQRELQKNNSNYISLPLLHDYDEKMPNFTFYGGRKQATMKFSFPFWTWIWFLRNSTPGEFAYIWQSKWVGTVAIKIEWTRIHFLSDVFAAVAVLGS